MSRASLGDVLFRADTDAGAALIDYASGEPTWHDYADLRRRSRAVAVALHQRGLTHGSRVGLLCGNSVRFVAAYYGALLAGCTVVPFGARAGADAIAHAASDAGLDLVVADGAPPAGVPGDIPSMDAMADAAFGAQAATADLSLIEAPPADPALLLYTSGSTGRAKGVMLSHASQLAIIDGLAVPGMREVLGRGPCIVAAPLHHMNGLIACQLVFACGGSVVLLRRFETRPFLEALARHRVTVITGVPTMIARLAQERDLVAELDLGSVELVVIGSAPLSDSVLAQARALFPRAFVMNSYGTTEVGTGIFGPHPAGLPRPPMSLGHPAAGLAMRLADGPSPDLGVLEVRGPTTMSGYLNLPALTAERIRDGWIRTGDLMRRDADGFHYFVGRADDMLVCGGENIYPGEVERLLERHPDVLEVAVVPLDDAIRGQVPVAFVVCRPGAQPSEQDLKDHVLALAAPYLHPRRVWFLQQMPLSAVNKVDRQLLTQRARQLAN